MPDIFRFIGEGVLPIFAIIVVVVLIVAYLGSRYKVAAANEALIISGRRERTAAGEQRLKVVRGQGVIVLPLLHRVGKLKLTARQIAVNLNDAVTRQGIKVAVQGVATFKIGADDESIQNAAERFLESRDEEVDSIVKNVLEGSLRSIVGTLTVEELNLDRQKFQQAVQEAAKADLATSGLQIDSFTIQAIRDESGYMELIGQQETARRERDARMAKASADQEAAVREAEAQQVKLNAQRDVSLRQAEVEALTQAAEAKASQAGPLAQAEAQQEVVRRQTELAQLEADRKQKELIASTIRPAEAEAEALIRKAEGEKQARIAQAQAEAERVKLAGQAEAAVQVTKGEAQARVVEVNATAEAQRTTLEGNAEAGITFTKGEAEAKALALRAEAYRQFNEAAVIQTVLSMLPEIVRAAAEPMGNIQNLTVLSSDGASDIVRTTTRTVAEAGAAVKGLTGIDVPGLLATAMGTAGRTNGATTPHEGGTGGGGEPSGGTARRRSGSTPPPAPAADGGTAPAIHGPAGRHGGAQAEVTSLPPLPPLPIVTIPPPPAVTAPPVETAARPTAGPVAPQLSTAPGQESAPPTPAPPTPAAARSARPRVAEVTADTPLDEAASRLADDLLSIPGIERFAGIRLANLDKTGPRPLRTLWRIAREQVDERYGSLTIGELIDRATGGSARPH